MCEAICEHSGDTFEGIANEQHYYVIYVTLFAPTAHTACRDILQGGEKIVSSSRALYMARASESPI